MIPRLPYAVDAIGILTSCGLASALFVTGPLLSPVGSVARFCASRSPVWFWFPTTSCCTNIARSVELPRSSTEGPIPGFQSPYTQKGVNPSRLPGVEEHGRPGLKASLIELNPSVPRLAFTPTPSPQVARNRVSVVILPTR